MYHEQEFSALFSDSLYLLLHAHKVLYCIFPSHSLPLNLYFLSNAKLQYALNKKNKVVLYIKGIAKRAKVFLFIGVSDSIKSEVRLGTLNILLVRINQREYNLISDGW